MAAVRRNRSAAIVIGAGVALAAASAQAASEVDVGGFHDRAIATTQQDLMGDVPAAGSPQAAGPVQMRMDVGPTSALTGFTPRLGGLDRRAGIPQRICSSTRPTKNPSACSSASATRPASLAGKSAWRRPRIWGVPRPSARATVRRSSWSEVSWRSPACASMLPSDATPRCSAKQATGDGWCRLRLRTPRYT